MDIGFSAEQERLPHAVKRGLTRYRRVSPLFQESGLDDPNRRHHIFGQPAHNLAPLVRRCGGEAAAGQAIYEAVDAALDSGALVVDGNGRYRQVFEIEGFSITVTGRVVDGVARVGTAWIGG